MNNENSTSKNNSNKTVEDCPYCGSKKYHIHGKVGRNLVTGESEISYYECDNIQCKKVFVLKNK